MESIFLQSCGQFKIPRSRSLSKSIEGFVQLTNEMRRWWRETRRGFHVDVLVKITV